MDTGSTKMHSEARADGGGMKGRKRGAEGVESLRGIPDSAYLDPEVLQRGFGLNF